MTVKTLTAKNIEKNIEKIIENEPWSAITHLIGAALSVAGLVLLVVFAAIHGTVWHVVGFTLFGASLIALYTVSTIYHFLPISTRAKHIMRRIDHAMIYVLIAGTYTPICIVTLRGPWGWSLFGVIWALTAAGVSIKASGVHMAQWLSTSIYAAMGWLMVVAFVPLIKSVPLAGLAWLLGGGLFYTFGAIIFSYDEIKLPWNHFGMHEIWHLFVLAASI